MTQLEMREVHWRARNGVATVEAVADALVDVGEDTRVPGGMRS